MPATAWDRDPFFQYPTTGFTTSVGDIRLPIFYYDDSLLMALFRVDFERARSVLKDPDLEVVPFGRSQAIAGLALYEYRDTAIGPYREVGVAIQVKPRGTPSPAWPLLSQLVPLDRRTSGFHILDLPVTTEAACSAGREAWGYPKFVAPIGFSLQGTQFKGDVADPAGTGDIFRLEGRTGTWLPGPLLDLVLYSRTDAGLLRTVVNTRGGGTTGAGGSLRVQVSDSSRHPMAERMRALGLQGARAFVSTASHRLQLRLNAGAVMP